MGSMRGLPATAEEMGLGGVVGRPTPPAGLARRWIPDAFSGGGAFSAADSLPR
jgi:hypothetical protein